MNQSRLKDFIAVMYRAKKYNCINMRVFQHWHNGRDGAETEEQLHKLFNTASASGYLALSEEWREAGGSVTRHGVPIFGGAKGTVAVQDFLCCRTDVAFRVLSGGKIIMTGDGVRISSYYNKPLSAVTAQEVIGSLESFLL